MMLPLKVLQIVCFNKFFLMAKFHVLDQAPSFLPNPNCHDLGLNKT
jgi:hypothetical protein